MKKHFVSGLLFSFSLLIFFPSCTKKEGELPLPTTLETGLVAHYSFDGNAEDISGQERHATIYGAALTSDRKGQSSSAYLFDGWDDMIVANSASGLNNNNLTYSAWVKPTANPSASDYTCLISIGGPGADQSMTINNNYHQTVGFNVGGYNNTATTSVSTIDSKQLPTLNEWVHVTYTRSNNEVRMYLNGVLKASVSTNSTLPKYNTPMVFTMGTRYKMDEAFFKGAIDEVRIYDRVLSASEVEQLYKQ